MVVRDHRRSGLVLVGLLVTLAAARPAPTVMLRRRWLRAHTTEARLTAKGKRRGKVFSLDTLLFAATFDHTHLPVTYPPAQPGVPPRRYVRLAWAPARRPPRRLHGFARTTGGQLEGTAAKYSNGPTMGNAFGFVQLPPASDNRATHGRGVRDEKVAGSNPVTPTMFGLVSGHF